MWLPLVAVEHAVPDGGRGAPLRTVAVACQGDLLGLLVLERPSGAEEFRDDEEQVVVDLARQLGLALHNLGLDRALEASLHELERRNSELVASRARIVAAGDASRRAIERDLHDGAQQHLVAMAARIGLIRSLIASDTATATELLEELRGDVQSTIDELRSLAQGVYPPLLRDSGLAAAMQAAAARAPVPTRVVTGDLGGHRYPGEVEAAVYFCCLEAIQNAAKHGGDDVSITVVLAESSDSLSFLVRDDGPGFDPVAITSGSGLVNMGDRLGALGGGLSVESVQGGGTTVRGEVPLVGTASAAGDPGERVSS